MKKALIASVTALTLAALFAAYKYGSRAGYEAAAYQVELEDGAFEIREYEPLLLASTPMAGRDAGEDDSFRRLFRYISGANAEDQKIAMTVPVFMTGDEEGGEMSFVAPREVAANGAPEATDEQVRLETMDGGRFAAYRFSGRRDAARTAEAERELLAWVRQQGLETAGEPIAAGYDPPFTPPFLRRNEVLIRLAG